MTASLDVANRSDLALVNEVFLELVLGDPDLLRAEFDAITRHGEVNKLPPGRSRVFADAHDASSPAALQSSTSGVRRLATRSELNPRRRNRQRSPPQLLPTWLYNCDEGQVIASI